MKAPCGIADDYIRVASLARGNGVKYNRRRVGAFGMFDYLRAGTLRPNLKLLNGGGAEGIRRCNDDFFARVLEPLRKLSYGGCLARSVYADYHNYCGLAFKIKLLAAAKHFRNDLRQHFPNLFRVGNSVFFYTFAKFFANGGSSRSAGISEHKRLFKVVKKLVVYASAGKNTVKKLTEGIPRFFKSLAYLTEKSQYSASYNHCSPSEASFLSSHCSFVISTWRGLLPSKGPTTPISSIWSIMRAARA